MRSSLVHFLIVPLLALSWFLIEEWYEYWNSRDGWLFAGCFVAALVLIAGKELAVRVREIGRRRMIVILLFSILCLPWGEWLRLALPEAREDWTRQLFHQACFLYALSILFRIFPGLLKKGSNMVLSVIESASRKDLLLWLPCILFFAGSSFIAAVILGQIPGTEDSAAHLFQAKIFAKLRLFAAAPPTPDFFDFQGDNLVLHNGKWFGMYLPGFALLLAPATLAGVEFFVSPLLGAFTLGIWIQYIRRWHSRGLALFFAVLFLGSPLLQLMSSAMMIHTPELFLASMLLYLIRSRIETPSAANGWGLAAVTLVTFLVRPFSILIFLAPALFYLTIRSFRERSLRMLLPSLCGGFVGFILLSVYQTATTGSPWLPAYLLEIPNCRLGFGQTLYEQIHTPARGLENVSNLILGLNSWLTRWGAGVIFFLILFLLQGKRTDVWDRILLSGGFCLAVFQFLFVGQDLQYGPRYFYLLAPVFLFYAARSSVLGEGASPGARYATVVLTISLVVASFAHSPRLIAEHRTTEDLRQLAQSQKEVVFFLEGNRRPWVSRNDPFFRNPVVYALDLGDRNPEVGRMFPGHRPVYFRPVVDVEDTNVEGSFEFSEVPDEGRSGVVDLFQLASMLDSTDHPDRDWFDLAYRGLFSRERSVLHLQYLEGLAAQEIPSGDYRSHFRSGLISAGQMLLLPAAAHLTSGSNWQKNLNPAEFRNRFFECRIKFEKSGAVSQRISTHLEKIGRRIDRDGNGEMTDREILVFVSYKVRLLEKY